MYIGSEGWFGFTGGDSNAIINGNLVDPGSLGLASVSPGSAETPWSYGRSNAGQAAQEYMLAIANRTKVYQGCQVKKTVSASTNVEPIFGVWDGATLQCWLGYNSQARQLNVYRGAGTTNLIAQSAAGGSIPAYSGTAGQGWFTVEWCPVIHPSAGTVEVRVNGLDVVINASGLNTRASGTSQITLASYKATESAGNGRMASTDYYCFDDQGAANNNFAGCVRVYTLFPLTDNSVQFTRNTGASNALAVDDPADIDDDSTYNADSTVGHKDSFNCSQLPATAVPLAFDVRVTARKDDVTARQVRSFVERAAVTANGTTRTMSSSYVMWVDRYETDPTDASALTAAKLNAMHLGYEVVT